VVGDLAGFAAATYQRGVPLVALPTTLLAQVDSSVGGKTAVNHPRGKNLIGAFHQPRLVASDPAVLTELPLPLLKDGAAEVVKYAVIGDRPFFEWLELNLERFWRRDRAALAEAVERSVRAKAAVVERDEQESDYRRILNFGHTVGHALESSTGYRYYRHGQAVLIGMAAATELARQLGLLASPPAARIQALLKKVGLKEPPAGLSTDAVMDNMRCDKKRRGDDLIFVLPRDIGSVVIQPVAETGLVEQLIHRYLARSEPFNAGE
jgi:3-dehydroquinate synthase